MYRYYYGVSYEQSTNQEHRGNKVIESKIDLISRLLKSNRVLLNVDEQVLYLIAEVNNNELVVA